MVVMRKNEKSWLRGYDLDSRSDGKQQPLLLTKNNQQKRAYQHGKLFGKINLHFLWFDNVPFISFIFAKPSTQTSHKRKLPFHILGRILLPLPFFPPFRRLSLISFDKKELSGTLLSTFCGIENLLANLSRKNSL